MTTMKNSRYNLDNICCAFVTYNGNESTIDNIRRIHSHIDCVVVIDNGSNNEFNNELMKLQNGIEIIRNPKNLGIAKALNQGMSFAITKNKPLYMTMDQDTEITRQAIMKLVEKIDVDNRVVSVGPVYDLTDDSIDKEARYLITSGNVLHVKALEDVGGYDESLFIDEVDIDLSFALRQKGYKLLKVSSARMKHKIGEYEHSRFLRIKHLTHKPIRFYYMYRNTILIARRYWRFIPNECLRLVLSLLVKDTAQLLLFERNKLEKCKYAIRGFCEGITIRHEELSYRES